MKPSSFIASLLLSVAIFSTDTMSATDVKETGYSIQAVTGDTPIRNVIVKRSGRYFTSYLGFQFDCVGNNYSQTGFYSSPEAAAAELSQLKRDNINNWDLSDMVRAKACVSEPGTTITSSAQSPSAS